MVVVFIAAMQSLFNWISGNSWYLLGNDPRYLGKKGHQSRFFNAGILACISVLNIVFITFIMSKMGSVASIMNIQKFFRFQTRKASGTRIFPDPSVHRKRADPHWSSHEIFT